jgi:flagellar biogenesis protein FliO
MSLLVVVGLFLAVVWLLRRGLPPGAHLLPREVVEVLGRTPLAGRQQAHLLRIGNKLVLVSVTPGGADTLTEVTDPLEVDRLAGLCRAAQPQSSTDAFQRILQQFAREKPAPGFFGTLVPSRPTEVAARVQPALEDDDDV